MLSEQRVEPLEIDGKKVHVIVEEFREGDGPVKKIQLRILKHADQDASITVSPASEEEAHRHAEEAQEKAEDAAHATGIQVERKRVNQLLQDAEWANREAAAQLERAHRVLRQSREKFESDHPAIREAEAELEDAQRQLKRHSSLRQALEARRRSETHDTAREMNNVMDREQSQAKAVEAADGARRKLEEQKELMQRQLEEQKKVIEELQKKLEEASHNENEGNDGASSEDKNSLNATALQSVLDEGLRITSGFVDMLPAAIDASSNTISFYVGFAR